MSNKSSQKYWEVRRHPRQYLELDHEGATSLCRIIVAVLMLRAPQEPGPTCPRREKPRGAVYLERRHVHLNPVNDINSPNKESAIIITHNPFPQEIIAESILSSRVLMTVITDRSRVPFPDNRDEFNSHQRKTLICLYSYTFFIIHPVSSVFSCFNMIRSQFINHHLFNSWLAFNQGKNVV